MNLNLLGLIKEGCGEIFRAFLENLRVVVLVAERASDYA